MAAQSAKQSYAIVQDSGQQFRMSEGEQVLVDLRVGLKPGDPIVFDKVVLLRDSGAVKIGNPLVDGAKVEGEVLGQQKGTKVTVFKYRRRKDSRVKRGHRAKYTWVQVKKIQAGG